MARDEYKSQLSALRDSISEDQKQRHQNIARIANELQKLVSDVATKASKSDLIDVASVLNSFPKVHEEIDNLKVFVNEEIQSSSDRIMETTVDKKQMKRTMTKLLKSLNEEMSHKDRNDTAPNCDSCAMRTGAQTGTACLMCSTRLRKEHQGVNYGPKNAVRGGGFSLTQPQRPNTSSRPNVMHTVGGMNGYSYTSGRRPMTVPNGLDADEVHHHHHHEPPNTARLPPNVERGSDGKLYSKTQAGSRTHRLMVNTPREMGEGAKRNRTLDAYARELKENAADRN